MGRLLPSPTALNMSVEYTSVVIFGNISIIEDAGESEKALRMLTEKYFPHLKYGEDYNVIKPEELKLTSVYRINIDKWSGKQKKVEDEFPGAFYYKDKL